MKYSLVRIYYSNSEELVDIGYNFELVPEDEGNRSFGTFDYCLRVVDL